MTFRYRESDLERVRDALRDAPLVTVLGPGGSGKTTLVRQLDDTRFVDLTACRTAADVEGAVERAVGTDLAAVQGTLVLDNCEQVEGLAALVGGWLDRVRIVATSRTPLQLRAERRVRLDALSEADAADLFVRRAAQHGVQLGPDAVLPVVRRLDGLPLAIELCASRVASLGLERLQSLLDEPLRVLADRKADRPERQSSLERTIAWSWALLSPAARAALAQIAVFAGAFTLDDCEWLALEGAWVGDVLEELVEASLLEPGFRLLEGVRAFALRHTTEDARHRFRQWLMARPPTPEVVEEAVLAFRAAVDTAPADAVALALWIDPVLTRTGPLPLRMEVVRTAHALDPSNARLRLRLAHAHMTRGEVDAAGALLEGLDTHPDPELAADAIGALARLASNRHDMVGARELWERARHAYGAIGDKDAMGRALAQRANFDKGLGRMDDAKAAMEASLALAREQQRPDATAFALALLGTMAHDTGDLDTAERCMAEAQSLFEAMGHGLRVGDLEATRGTLALERGDLDTAAASVQRGIDVHAEHGAPRWIGWYRVLLASIRFLQGRVADAEAIAKPAVTGLRQYVLPGTSEISVLFGCLLVSDAALTAVWRDEVAERVRRLRFSPVLEAALSIVDGAWAGELARVRAALSTPGETHPAMLAWSSEVRLLLLVAEKRAGTAAKRGFTFGDGWFETPAGEHVDLRTRAALRRILAALVDARGGPGLSMEEVFEAGWPGQNIGYEAAANRVYTSIAALRKMGLGDVLVRHDDGYRLEEG
ncbi:MAG: hypothetical protein H6737_24725 [Alphaproteobacteria bacterium]|nr:hypothetical protein [Alphaproteobacteria bacterium]